MLYINDDKLKADQIQVVESHQVKELVAEGWRILGVLSSTTHAANPEPQEYNTGVITPGGRNYSGYVTLPGWPSAPIQTPLFIMGRDGETADLHHQLAGALKTVNQANARTVKAKNALSKADAANDDLTGRLQEQLTQTTEAGNLASKERAARLKMTAAVAVIRKEVGEARWREILGALEVEETLLEASTDDDIPF